MRHAQLGYKVWCQNLSRSSQLDLYSRSGGYFNVNSSCSLRRSFNVCVRVQTTGATPVVTGQSVHPHGLCGTAPCVRMLLSHGGKRRKRIKRRNVRRTLQYLQAHHCCRHECCCAQAACAGAYSSVPRLELHLRRLVNRRASLAPRRSIPAKGTCRYRRTCSVPARSPPGGPSVSEQVSRYRPAR